MSVIATRRAESKAEFVKTAFEIYTRTINFLTRLSSRYSRLIAEDVAHLASEVIDSCEKANSIYLSSDKTKLVLRSTYLVKARASLMALDVHLAQVYEILIQNTAGCFTNAKGEPVDKTHAQEILDKLAATLGCLIDTESGLIKRVIESDKERYKAFTKQ